MTSDSGLSFVPSAVRAAAYGTLSSLGSRPCTWGAAWQHINGASRRSDQKYIAHAQELYLQLTQLLKNCGVVGRDVLRRGGLGMLEWPPASRLRKERGVQGMQREFQVDPVSLEGCAVGPEATPGSP